MKIQIIDGEVTEVSQQDWQAFEAWRKEQAKDWPQIGDSYWIIYASGEVSESRWGNDSDDYELSAVGNIYRTEAEALDQVEKLKAKARIDKYIADNGLAFDRDIARESWAVGVTHRREIEVMNFAYHYGLPYVFATKSHAQQVIDNCTDDLKTIFGVK